MKKRNKRRNKKRRVLLCLLMLCLTGVVLSTSTYAWFTANKTVTVSDINVNVSTANGIQVSVDGINWKTVITNADITGAVTTYPAAKNQLPATGNSLSPVSTIGEIDTQTGFMKMFSGEIIGTDSGNILTAERSTEVNGTAGHFIAFDLFVQVTEEVDVYLTSNSEVVANGDSTGIENAARMGFIVSGTVAAGSTTADIQKIAATTGSEPVYLWELNNDAHTSTGVANASDVYGITGLTAGTNNAAVSYLGVKADIAEDAAIPLDSDNSTYFSAISFTGNNFSTPSSGIPSTAYQKLHTFDAGITKLRVYMWVEGQDVDCENYASGGDITYSLQLSTNEKAA